MILRVVFAQAGALAEWRDIDRGVTSALAEVECLRTLDRRARQGLLDPETLADRRAFALRLLGAMERVDLSLAVLRRAAEPFPTPLGTLDALHLATAVLWGAQQDALPAFATHDQQLGTAARALGMRVVGV